MLLAVAIVVLVVSSVLFGVGLLNGELQKEIREQFGGLESSLSELKRSVEQVRSDLHDINHKIERGGKLW